jgi:Tfp pilus assembly protein PilF
VRVTAQLIEASSGHHVWAERYDRQLEDIFEVQDEITRAIVSVVPERVEDAARQRTERSRTLDWSAYDFVLVGIERWRRFSREGFVEARRMFEKALELDPHYARAHANLAWTYVWEVFLELSSGESLDKALKLAGKALTLDGDDGWSHGVLAQALFLARRDEEAQIHFRRALALNPNDADISAVFANILVYWGRVDEALEWIAVAKRLNPFPPTQYHWYQALAFYSAREYEQAALAIKEAQVLEGYYRGLLAACYGQMGRVSEARAEAEVFVKDRQRELEERGEPVPRNTLDLALGRADRYRVPSDREHFLDGLRKAGLVES